MRDENAIQIAFVVETDSFGAALVAGAAGTMTPASTTAEDELPRRSRRSSARLALLARVSEMLPQRRSYGSNNSSILRRKRHESKSARSDSTDGGDLDSTLRRSSAPPGIAENLMGVEELRGRGHTEGSFPWDDNEENNSTGLDQDQKQRQNQNQNLEESLDLNIEQGSDPVSEQTRTLSQKQGKSLEATSDDLSERDRDDEGIVNADNGGETNVEKKSTQGQRGSIESVASASMNNTKESKAIKQEKGTAIKVESQSAHDPAPAFQGFVLLEDSNPPEPVVQKPNKISREASLQSSSSKASEQGRPKSPRPGDGVDNRTTNGSVSSKTRSRVGSLPGPADPVSAEDLAYRIDNLEEKLERHAKQTIRAIVDATGETGETLKSPEASSLTPAQIALLYRTLQCGDASPRRFAPEPPMVSPTTVVPKLAYPMHSLRSENLHLSHTHSTKIEAIRDKRLYGQQNTLAEFKQQFWNKCAAQIQAAWRGYRTRQDLIKSLSDRSRLQHGPHNGRALGLVSTISQQARRGFQSSGSSSPYGRLREDEWSQHSASLPTKQATYPPLSLVSTSLATVRRSIPRPPGPPPPPNDMDPQTNHYIDEEKEHLPDSFKPDVQSKLTSDNRKLSIERSRQYSISVETPPPPRPFKPAPLYPSPIPNFSETYSKTCDLVTQAVNAEEQEELEEIEQEKRERKGIAEAALELYKLLRGRSKTPLTISVVVSKLRRSRSGVRKTAFDLLVDKCIKNLLSYPPEEQYVTLLPSDFVNLVERLPSLFELAKEMQIMIKQGNTPMMRDVRSKSRHMSLTKQESQLLHAMFSKYAGPNQQSMRAREFTEILREEAGLTPDIAKLLVNFARSKSVENFAHLGPSDLIYFVEEQTSQLSQSRHANPGEVLLALAAEVRHREELKESKKLPSSRHSLLHGGPEFPFTSLREAARYHAQQHF